MEIPFEIKSILDSDLNNNNSNNDYIILEPSIFKYFTEEEKYSLCYLLNELGELSKNDRHLSSSITSFVSFISNTNSTSKKLILKCINDLIIGFIYFEEKPILLRNDFNLNYFYKNLLTISDFYIMSNYRRMGYGKELFDKVIYMTNVKPVLMAFECPSKALMNFLVKYYGIGNPIYQLNDVVTFYNYKDEKFNRYLDDYHRVIDVNKMEDDIDNYRKWSPLDNDYYKRFNSDSSYKNIFPLKFNNKGRYNHSQNSLYKMNNNRYNNIENNYIKNYNDKNNSNNNINNEMSYSRNNNQNNKYNPRQFHLRDKKNIYGKINNKKNTPIPLAIKEITSNRIKDIDKKYFHKFTDYYLNQNKSNINYNNNTNNHRYARNSVKNNYYNYINDENRYIRNIYKSQKFNEDRLNMSVNRLSDRINNNEYRTPIRNKNDSDSFYRKNRSFATIFDSIENNKEEEKDFFEYKKYKKENEFID